MRRFLLLSIVVCISGCGEMARQRALAVTRQYIEEHHLPLPHGYVAEVQDAVFISADGQSQSFMSYSVRYTIHGKELYYFTIPRNTSQVFAFDDRRSKSQVPVVH